MIRRFLCFKRGKKWQNVMESQEFEAACHECLGTNSVVSKGVFLKHYGEDFPYEEYKAEMAKVFFSHASGGKLQRSRELRNF